MVGRLARLEVRETGLAAYNLPHLCHRSLEAVPLGEKIGCPPADIVVPFGNGRDIDPSRHATKCLRSKEATEGGDDGTPGSGCQRG